MSWALAGGNVNFTVKKKPGRAEHQSSSEEYEESDEESRPQIFQVRRIVDHKKLIKGQVYKQARGLEHTFDVSSLEKSKMDYAFKVRWRGYGEPDDTWEPIENMKVALAKKVRRYFKKKNLTIPEGFEAWMEPNSTDDDDSSEAEAADERRSVERTKATPPSSNNTPKAELKIKLKLLKEDLALSPSPSPRQPPKNQKRGFDPLFDDTDDEKKERVKKKREGDNSKRRSSSTEASCHEKKKGQKEGSIDPEEAQRKKEMRKKELAKDREFVVSDSNDGKDDGVEKRKKKSRADLDLDKQAAEHIKQLAEEERQKKEKKRAKRREKERRKAEEAQKKRNEMFNQADMNYDDDEAPRRLLDSLQKSFYNRPAVKDEDEMSADEEPKKVEIWTPLSYERWEPEAVIEKPTTVTPPPSDSKKLSQYELEMKKKKLLEEKKKEKVSPLLIKKTTVSPPSDSQRMSHHELEMKKKKKKLEEKKKEMASSVTREVAHKRDEHKKEIRRNEEKKEKEAIKRCEVRFDVKNVKKEVMEEEKGAKKRETKHESDSDGGCSPLEESKEEKQHAKRAVAKAPLAKDRVGKARARLALIQQRLADFAYIASGKELIQQEKWRVEEDEFRRRMYYQKKWKRDSMIKDVPFNIRAEQTEKDPRRVRMLRRCSSLERLPHSYRRLSSLHSMNSLASDADSLSSALIDLRIGDTAQHRLRVKAREAEEKMKQLRKNEKIVPDSTDISGKTEQFIRETIAMTDELIPGIASEEIIREMSVKAIGAFLSLSYESLIPIFQTINFSQCINRTILRLVRIFSPVLNLAEATDYRKGVCDEGEHRKCRMLLTLLMTLSEPHRMGDGEECLLPPNALYDAIDVSAPCQIRALIRGGCTFDGYYDEEGKNAAHRMMEKEAMTKLVWLIERGLDVNSAIMPQKESDLGKDVYDKPWKIVKGCNEKAAFVSQLHSNRLTARSVLWTKSVQGVGGFNLRPLTLVHTLNPHSYFHRFAAVTLCDDDRKGFDRNDAVILAVHSATVRHGEGLRTTLRKAKKAQRWHVPYFLIDQSTDDQTFEHVEKYECTRARLTIYDLNRPVASETVELTRVGSNGATTVYKVPKKQAHSLVSGRRFTESLLKLVSPPEHSVILAQYFIIPYRNAMGKFTD